MDKTAKLEKYSESQFKRTQPPSSQWPQLLTGASGIQPPEIAQKDCTNEGTPDGVNCVHLKVTKAEGFFFLKGSYMCALIFKLGKRQTHVFGQSLLFKQRQYNFQWYLTSA
jgi:hypothetical protein